MTVDDSEKRKGGGLLAVGLAGIVGLVAFAALFVLLAQIAVAVAAILGLILLASLFHYLAWGRWIGDSIRREVDEEDRADGTEKR